MLNLTDHKKTDTRNFLDLRIATVYDWMNSLKGINSYGSRFTRIFYPFS